MRGNIIFGLVYLVVNFIKEKKQDSDKEMKTKDKSGIKI